MDTPDEADGGFTLLEVVVAMVLTGVLAAVVAGLLTTALDVSRSTSQRTVAANIASAEIEEYRAQRAVDLTDGVTTSTATVDGTAYTVHTEISLTGTSTDANLCTASDADVALRRIRVSVDWPARGSGQPVTMDTTKALGLGSAGLDPTKGIAAVLVTGGTGDPVAGVPVQLSPSAVTITTGSDGCAVFPGLDSTQVYSATLDLPGYVGVDGVQRVVREGITVQSSKSTRVAIRYDLPGSLAVTAAVPAAGAQLPDGGVGTSLRFTLRTPQTIASTCTALTGTCSIDGLFPDAANAYSVWAGTCAEAQPTGPDSAFVLRSGSVPVSVSLGAVPVAVVAKDGKPVKGKAAATPTPVTITAVPLTSSGCLGTETYTFSGVLDQAVLALPQGTWQLTTSDKAVPSTVTVTAGAVAASTDVRLA